MKNYLNDSRFKLNLNSHMNKQNFSENHNYLQTSFHALKFLQILILV